MLKTGSTFHCLVLKKVNKKGKLAHRCTNHGELPKLYRKNPLSSYKRYKYKKAIVIQSSTM